jgi:cytoskeletal protein CcmA (bactofilin family)
VRGDVVAAGGQVLIEGRVEGDVLAAGGVVDVSAETMDDVRAAGGVVTLRGPITGDAVAAGGTVVLTRDAVVGGRAWFGGGNVDVAGQVGATLKVAARKIALSGAVGGDVEITADEIEVLPGARISGALTYRSPRPAHIDPAAEIRGGVTYVPVEGPSFGGRVAARLLFVVAIGVLGAVLILLFPRFSAATVATVGRHPWPSLGFGAAAAVGGPLLGALLAATVVGLALGAAVFVVWGLAMAAGFLAGTLLLGALATQIGREGAPDSRRAWVGALAIGLLLVAAVGFIPVVGGLVPAALALVGAGAVMRTVWDRWRPGDQLGTPSQ